MLINQQTTPLSHHEGPYLHKGRPLWIMHKRIVDLINPPTVAEPLWQVAIEVKTNCAHRGIFECLWLSFWPLSTIPDNCFYQSNMVNRFWPVNVLSTRKVWLCWTFKCTRYTPNLACTGMYINIWTDFDPCNHKRVLKVQWILFT